MKIHWLELEPVDAWTFRDGRPGTMEQATLPSLFPPSPMTIVGAVRAALARQMGWQKGEWPDEIKAKLGDGSDFFGQLRFTAAVLVRGEQYLFPCPRCLYLEGNQPATLGRPVESTNALKCDLGVIRLPRPVTPSPGIEEPDDWWITLSGMKSVLKGELPPPDEMARAEKLFVFEKRVGLELNLGLDDVPSEFTRQKTAKKGQLYSPHYVRLRQNVRLIIGVGGLEAINVNLPIVFPIGGEGRLCGWRETAGDPFAGMDVTSNSEQQALVLLSPALFSEDRMPHPNQELIPGVQLVSMCCDRPSRLGGWRGRNPDQAKSEPKRPVLQAGTVLFVEGDASRIRQLVKIGVGERTTAGFGKVVSGAWAKA